MKIHKSFVLNDSIERTWDFFMNPKALSVCLPGCEEIEVKDDRTYIVKLKLRVAYIGLNFKVKVDIVDINFPYLIKAIGRGDDDGKLSSVKLESLFQLKAIKSNSTEVSYDVDLSIQGRLGRIANPILEEKIAQLGNVFEENVKKAFSCHS